MGLHVVDADEGDVPGKGQTFGCVETDGEVRPHAGPSRGGYEVRLLAEFAIVGGEKDVAA